MAWAHRGSSPRLRVIVDDRWAMALAPPGPYLVGRSDDAWIRVLDLRVSPRHALLRWDAGSWRYSCAAGAGPSWVDGRRVGSCPVGSGARVVLGCEGGPELRLEVLATERVFV